MLKRQLATLEGFPEEIDRLRAKLPNSIVLLVISLGQKYHEGSSMLATLEMARATFPHVIFIIADELQAYNRFTKESEPFTLNQLEIYREDLLEEGKQWQRNHEEEIKEHLPSYEIRTWRQYLRGENFTEIENFVLALYEGINDDSENSCLSDYKKVYQALKGKECKEDFVPIDTEFKKLVMTCARKKTPKKMLKNRDVEQERVVSMNIKYILEECIVYIQWALEWKSKSKDVFLVYPAEINPALNYLKRKFFDSVFTPLTINFSPVSKVEYNHTKADTIHRGSDLSDSSSSSEEKETSPLILIPKQCKATNITDVKLTFQRNLLNLIKYAIDHNLDSHDERVESLLFTFLKCMAGEIPCIPEKNKGNEFSQSEEFRGLELIKSNSGFQAFLQGAFLEMYFIAERVKNPEDINPIVLECWCENLNGYANRINALIDSIRSDKSSEAEMSSISTLTP